jgi:hypothetical protein
MIRYPFIPYPTIEKHGLLGDRRTAAAYANDARYMIFYEFWRIRP